MHFVRYSLGYDMWILPTLEIWNCPSKLRPNVHRHRVHIVRFEYSQGIAYFSVAWFLKFIGLQHNDKFTTSKVPVGHIPRVALVYLWEPISIWWNTPLIVRICHLLVITEDTILTTWQLSSCNSLADRVTADPDFALRFRLKVFNRNQFVEVEINFIWADIKVPPALYRL